MIYTKIHPLSKTKGVFFEGGLFNKQFNQWVN